MDPNTNDVVRREACIRLNLPQLYDLKAPWVFLDLDLRGYATLSSVSIATGWRFREVQHPKPAHLVRSVAASVILPVANGRWAAAHIGGWSKTGIAKKRVSSIHWHALNTQCYQGWEGCKVGHE
jgi:hypothetical protein